MYQSGLSQLDQAVGDALFERAVKEPIDPREKALRMIGIIISAVGELDTTPIEAVNRIRTILLAFERSEVARAARS